jgi:hypothetical protein
MSVKLYEPAEGLRGAVLAIRILVGAAILVWVLFLGS